MNPTAGSLAAAIDAVAAGRHSVRACLSAKEVPRALIADILAIAGVLGFGPQEQLVCGTARGYADPSAIESSLRTERAGLDQLVVFHE